MCASQNSQITEITVHMFNSAHIFPFLMARKITEYIIIIKAVKTETYRNTYRSPGGSKFKGIRNQIPDNLVHLKFINIHAILAVDRSAHSIVSYCIV